MAKPDKGWARRRGRDEVKKQAGAGSAAAVVKTIQREAKEAGATLKSDGEGGLDPRLALKIFRKAKWRCENTNCPDPQKELDLDHQSGHPKEILDDPEARKDPKSRAAAKESDPKDDRFLHCLCKACHDAVHERERAIEAGEDPPPMPGS